MVLAKQKQSVASKARGKGSKKKLSRGTAKLNEAADKTLENNSDKIANSLLNSTLDGNISSAKLLIALAEGLIDCEDAEVMERLCSFAESLASEPEWVGELNETEAETGLGRREPED
jgi:hypothetical protein